MSKDTARRKRLSVLVVGDSCTDVFVRGTCSRLSPEAPVPVLDHVTTEHRPGMAGNVVINLKALGVEPMLITQDEIIKKTRFVEDRSGQHLLRFDETPEVTPIDDFTTKLATDTLRSCDALVFVDYDKGFLHPLAIERLCYTANELDLPIYVDSKRKDMSDYRQCHVKLNELEDETLFAHPLASEELIITLGSRGARRIADDTVYAPEQSYAQCDVVGAGDTFLAGYVYAHLVTGDVPTAIRFANDCASSVVKQFGTSVPTEADIQRAKEKHLGGS